MPTVSLSLDQKKSYHTLLKYTCETLHNILQKVNITYNVKYFDKCIPNMLIAKVEWYGAHIQGQLGGHQVY